MILRRLFYLAIGCSACSGGVTSGPGGADAGGAGPGSVTAGTGGEGTTAEGGSSTTGPSLCGNGSREGSEACDLDDFGTASCTDFGMTGNLGCLPSCELDKTACVGCGNGLLDPGELCDGALVVSDCLDGAAPAWIDHLVNDLGIEPHAVIDGIRGAPTCTSTCELDFSTCGYCFDGVISPAESCELSGLGPEDTADYGGLSCEDFGLGPGQLGCLACGILTDGCAGTPTVPCLGGNCSLRFTASTQGVLGNRAVFPWSDAFDNGPLTVEYWVRVQGLSSGPSGWGLASGDAPGSGFRLGSFLPAPDAFEWWGQRNGLAFSAVAPGVLAGPWHHLAGVFDPTTSTARVYLDGALTDEAPTGPGYGTTPTGPIYAGRTWDSAPPCEMGIDEIRISSVVRYSANFTPEKVFTVDADTLALWHLDDDDGVLVDSGPLGLDGATGGSLGGEWSGDHP